MGADLKFPSAEQRTMLRTAPRLELPSPAGNPAHSLAMPAADTPASSSAAIGCDWILELPSLSAVRAPDPGASSEPAGATASAAGLSGNRMEAAPADALSVSDLPLDVLDRTGSRPAGNVDVEGEALPSSNGVVGQQDDPPPVPNPVGVSNCPAAGVPVQAMEAVMIERMKHFDNGHDLASDVAAIADNPRKLSRRAERCIVHAIEDLQFHRPGFRTRAKHHIAQAAAMLLAFYDAVDAMPQEPGQEPSDAI